MPPPNNQHAARLREMAYFEQSKAEEWEKHATSLVPPCGYSHRGCAKAAETCRTSAAALLAGAEALEILVEAKPALKEIIEGLNEAVKSYDTLGPDWTVTGDAECFDVARIVNRREHVEVAHNALPALLAEIRELRDRNKHLEEGLQESLGLIHKGNSLAAEHALESL